jgi:hypothetical protein
MPIGKIGRLNPCLLAQPVRRSPPATQSRSADRGVTAPQHQTLEPGTVGKIESLPSSGRVNSAVISILPKGTLGVGNKTDWRDGAAWA